MVEIVFYELQIVIFVKKNLVTKLTVSFNLFLKKFPQVENLGRKLVR